MATIGVLLSAGHTLDDVLDMSYAQIAWCAASVQLTRLEFVAGLVSPLLPEGSRYKRGRVGRHRGRPRDPAQREAALMRELAAMGVPIVDAS